MIKNLKNIDINHVIYLYIVLLLTYIFFSNISVIYQRYTILELSMGLIVFSFIGLVLNFINKKIKKLKFDILDLLIIILIICGIISTIFAINTKIALYGFGGRNEGLLQLICYYMVFLNCKNLKDRNIKNNIITIIIFFSCIQSIYGILQFFNIKSILGIDIIRHRYYSNGFETNPNFFGTVTIIGLSLSLTIYLFSKKRFATIITLFSSVLLFLGLLCSGAMSVMVASIFMIVCLIILFFILKIDLLKSLLKIIIVLPLLLIAYCAFDKYSDGFYFKQVNECMSEIGDSLSGNAEPLYGSGRIYIWQKTLEIVPQNLWNGVGIENLYYAFGENPLKDINSGGSVDKAHNEYLHKLITEGIFSLITYMFLLGIIAFKSIKKILKNREKNSCQYCSLLICFIAYCVQAFFNISVISVAPMFYIVMGLLCASFGDDSHERIND